MRTLRTLIIGLSSILPMLVLQYEAKTGLGENWEANRALLEERMRLNHTNLQSGEFYESSYDGNVKALDLYKGSLDAARKLTIAPR